MTKERSILTEHGERLGFSCRLSLRSRWLTGFCTSLWLILPQSAAADTITLDAIAAGFYTETWAFRDGPLNVGYAPGDIGDLHHNYLVFDLSALAGYQVNSATAHIGNYNRRPNYFPEPYCPDRQPIGCPIGYISPDPSETFALWDVTTPVERILSGTPTDAYTAPTFADLGSGTSFGSVVLTEADTGFGVFVDVVFNAEGVAFLNSAIGAGNFTQAFGGSVTTLTANTYQELLFAGSGPYTQYPGAPRQLVLEVAPQASVPLPAAAGLFLSAVGVLGSLKMRILPRICFSANWADPGN